MTKTNKYDHLDGATRYPQHTVAEAITLPRIPWAEIPSSIIDVVITEAAEAGDKVLVHRARAALARRIAKSFS